MMGRASWLTVFTTRERCGRLTGVAEKFQEAALLRV
jgi:hypothetical protein